MMFLQKECLIYIIFSNLSKDVFAKECLIYLIFSNLSKEILHIYHKKYDSLEPKHINVYDEI